MQFDPGGEVCKDAGCFLQRLGPEAGVVGVVHERAAVVDRPHLGCKQTRVEQPRRDAATQQHLPEPGRLLLDPRYDPERQLELLLGGDARDLDRGDHPQDAVVPAAAPDRVAMRSEADQRGAGRTVSGDEIPDRVEANVEAELKQLRGEVLDGAEVGLGERVAGAHGVTPSDAQRWALA